MMKQKLITAIILSVFAFTAGAQKKGGSEEMEIVPSVWYAGLRGDMDVEGKPAGIVRKSDDYFKNLDLGGSLEMTVRNNKMVIYGSFDYFETITSDVKVGTQVGELESSEIIGVVAVGYPLASGSGKNIDLLMGYQTLRIENDLTITGGGKVGASTHIYDPVIMLRIRQALAGKLYIDIPLSIGGYFGDSDLVYQAGLQLQIQFTDNFDVRAGYRIAGFDYEKNDFNSLDFYQQGWTLGLGISF